MGRSASSPACPRMTNVVSAKMNQMSCQVSGRGRGFGTKKVAGNGRAAWARRGTCRPPAAAEGWAPRAGWALRERAGLGGRLLATGRRGPVVRWRGGAPGRARRGPSGRPACERKKGRTESWRARQKRRGCGGQSGLGRNRGEDGGPRLGLVHRKRQDAAPSPAQSRALRTPLLRGRGAWGAGGSPRAAPLPRPGVSPRPCGKGGAAVRRAVAAVLARGGAGRLARARRAGRAV